MLESLVAIISSGRTEKMEGLVFRPWVKWTAIALVVVGVLVLGNIAFNTAMSRIDITAAIVVGAILWIVFAIGAWASSGVDWQKSD